MSTNPALSALPEAVPSRCLDVHFPFGKGRVSWMLCCLALVPEGRAGPYLASIHTDSNLKLRTYESVRLKNLHPDEVFRRALIALALF